MQFRTLLPLLGFATAALSAPAPQTGTDGTTNPDLKPFQVINLSRNITSFTVGNFTRVQYDTSFRFIDPNSGTDEIPCSAVDVLSNQLYPCNGGARFGFSDDFDGVGIMQLFSPEDVGFTSGNGSATGLKWKCLDPETEGIATRHQCTAEDVKVPVDIAL